MAYKKRKYTRRLQPQDVNDATATVAEPSIDRAHQLIKTKADEVIFNYNAAKTELEAFMDAYPGYIKAEQSYFLTAKN